MRPWHWINTAMQEAFERMQPVPSGLADPKAFFADLRTMLGPLKQSQVDGFNALLNAMRGWPVSWAAYGLATAWHETAKTMQPVREAYWTSENWRAANLRYYPWYGRGYVQLTWEDNYRRMGEKLGVDLIADKDKALDPKIAADIMVRGMVDGDFTGKSLPQCLPDEIGSTAQFKEARKIINGRDKASLIAGYADFFQDALTAGEWR